MAGSSAGIFSDLCKKALCAQWATQRKHELQNLHVGSLGMKFFSALHTLKQCGEKLSANLNHVGSPPFFNKNVLLPFTKSRAKVGKDGASK